MFFLLRSVIGILAIVGFGTAITLLMLVEWKRIRSNRPGFVPLFHRIRRIVTGLLMIVLLGLCFYGWWFMKESVTIHAAQIYLKTVFTILSIIFLSLLWDCVAVYQSMDSFFDRMTQTKPVTETAEEVLEEGEEGTETLDRGSEPGEVHEP